MYSIRISGRTSRLSAPSIRRRPMKARPCCSPSPERPVQRVRHPGPEFAIDELLIVAGWVALVAGSDRDRGRRGVLGMDAQPQFGSAGGGEDPVGEAT